LAKTAANSENQFHLHERVFLFWGTLPQDQSFCIHWLVSEENNNKTIQISPFEYCIKNVFVVSSLYTHKMRCIRSHNGQSVQYFDRWWFPLWKKPPQNRLFINRIFITVNYALETCWNKIPVLLGIYQVCRTHSVV